ncbi:hypothetical protein KAI23_01000 [Candidatus Bathyarchaeota archaeon]|nr:hypothetical protein [Candidatus Bathyarchaeota archaeon]
MMMRKVLSSSIIAILLVSTAAVMIPFAYSQRPVVNSQYTGSPPTIDGTFTPGEWFNLQIVMTEPDFPIDAFAYFMNDDFNLYVLVDAIEDTTENSNDECLLIFDFESNKIIRIRGTSENWQKNSENFEAAIGFDSSPNSPNTHMIYEFRIPLSYINIEPGESIDFCSPFWKNQASIPYDPDGGIDNDNIWPPEIGTGTEWQTDRDLWGILSSGRHAPVGGLVTPVNKLSILTPYLALVALIGAVISIAIRRTRK